MPRYSYEGPVRVFDTCVNPRWKGQTWADSEKKARSNLSWQYKQETNRTANAKVCLTGKILREGE